MKHIVLSIAMFSLAIGLMAAQFSARYIKTEAANHPLLISSVQVLDSSDEPIQDLGSKNFRVLMDGKGIDSLKTVTYQKSGQGLHIFLCVDASGTMKGTPIASIKAAVLPFIDKIRTVDKVAIGVYSDDFQLLTDFTGEKELLKSTLNSINPQGKYTSLYYGAYKALQRLAANEDKTGKILILMGDGKDENPAGSYAENDVIALAKDSGIPIFTIGYTKVESVYLQSLERIAEQTGGSFYYAPASSDLDRHFDKLYSQIMNIYLLSYLVTGIPGDGAEHDLGIEVKTDFGVKPISAKVLLPAGRGTYTPMGSRPKSKLKLSLPVIGFIVLGILALATLWYFLHRKAKKEKAAREAQQQLLEEQRKQEEERKKAMEAEAKITPEIPVAVVNEAPILDFKEAAKPKIPSSREHTMILGGSSQPDLRPALSGSLRMEIVFGSDAGKVFNIEAPGAAIGRNPDNQIVLTDNTVSSHHAKITFVDGFFVLEDLGATNGVFINGNKTQIYRMEASCTFKFGAVEGNFTLV